MENQVAEMHGNRTDKNEMIRVWLPPPSTSFGLITGRWINLVPDDRIVEMTEEEFKPLINSGARLVD
jgi:hypothetical protein